MLEDLAYRFLQPREEVRREAGVNLHVVGSFSFNLSLVHLYQTAATSAVPTA